MNRIQSGKYVRLSCRKRKSRDRNHLAFSLWCCDKDVTPPSLKKCGIKTQNTRDIIKKAEKGLIRERIRLINKLEVLQDRKEELVQEINEQLPSNESKRVFALDESSRERI